eukprot:TRINITY_DN5378_c0_g1_i3.p1 TRINITY_DN5378_c0_g1~~TRINITY_DN5378_c0_g1_i3.p1  ORF type:complete len:644 (-),score=174.50 TRINITY_DN5378_c0_g1_i3:462-2360(-)
MTVDTSDPGPAKSSNGAACDDGDDAPRRVAQQLEDPSAVEGQQQPEDGGLAAAGISSEDLDLCVDVLQRLAAAREQLNMKAARFRELRKALVAHTTETFAGLPNKQEMDKKQRDKFAKEKKREQQMKQVAADKRWKDNAQLRSSRLAKLEALEEASRSRLGGQAALQDVGDDAQPVEEDAPREAGSDVAAAAGAKALRIPDGPAKSSPCSLQGPEAAETAAEKEAAYARQQSCYICKVRFQKRHHFYASLCPACADLNFAKRHQAVDLKGRICLVTGARVKIGFETALKLLRMGAHVIATSRFPNDTLRRFNAESDAEDWKTRLEIWGLDFRFLPRVEGFCSELCKRHPHLDVIINNACQTIRRPAAYYRHLLHGEDAAVFNNALPASRFAMLSLVDAAASVAPAAEQMAADQGSAAAASFSPKAGYGSGGAAGAPAAPQEADCAISSAVRLPPEMSAGESAAMSQLAVLPEDAWGAAEAEAALPGDEYDAHGQQLDLRERNSWLLKLGEVSTPEAVEAMCINAMAPFILNGRLRVLLERSPHSDRYIVNVSAMEGKFYRWKQPTHPHTNMAKASSRLWRTILLSSMFHRWLPISSRSLITRVWKKMMPCIETRATSKSSAASKIVVSPAST